MTPASAEPMLSVAGVDAFYGAVQALSGVDLEVRGGEIVALIGANGAGKSTLLMTICGSPRARGGQILFEGEDITARPTHDIAQLGIAHVPEGRHIFPRMSVMENLQLGAITADESHFSEDLDYVFGIIEQSYKDVL